LDRFADLVQVLDANGSILYAAGPLSAQLGPVVGKPFVDFFHPDDRTLIKEALQRAAESNQPEKFGAVRVHTADFKWRELDGSLQQMASRGRTPETLVIAQDVTDVHALERQLERAARVDSLGRVAAKVAHEFNNVLMALHTNIDVLQRKYHGDPQIQTVSETMKRSVLRGTQIAKEILRFSRPTEIREAPIVIESWLRQLEEELRPLLPPKIEFELEVAPEKLLLCG